MKVYRVKVSESTEFDFDEALGDEPNDVEVDYVDGAVRPTQRVAGG